MHRSVIPGNVLLDEFVTITWNYKACQNVVTLLLQITLHRLGNSVWLFVNKLLVPQVRSQNSCHSSLLSHQSAVHMNAPSVIQWKCGKTAQSLIIYSRQPSGYGSQNSQRVPNQMMKQANMRFFFLFWNFFHSRNELENIISSIDTKKFPSIDTYIIQVRSRPYVQQSVLVLLQDKLLCKLGSHER